MAKKGQTPRAPEPKTENQKHYISSIQSKPMTIAVGSAGTGKSYLAASMAAKYLKEKTVKKIVLTRPTVPTGRSIGFFPGSLNEKMEPWCKPIMNTLEEILGRGDVESQVRNENIEIVPFETIRGRSFEDTFIILDEAQNCTHEELKAFVTRAGENSTTVINGDTTQSDLKGRECGLIDLVKMVKNSDRLRKFVGLIEFNSQDIVRSGMCQIWVEEFEKDLLDDSDGLKRILQSSLTDSRISI